MRTVERINMPVIGLGTWRSHEQQATDVVKKALALGYRHIDTAQRYDNERAVGRGIKEADVAREDIFLTTKIYPNYHSRTALPQAVECSLRELQTDYLDLLLLHWPAPDIPLQETFATLTALKQRGLIKHIGVSNFTIRLLREAQHVCAEQIVVNQVEYHPFIQQTKLLSYMDEQDIVLTAYAPIARGKVFEQPILNDIAARHATTPAVISLAWIIARRNRSAIPKTVTDQYLLDNLAADDINLSSEEMRAIDSIARADQRIVSHRLYTPEWDD